jgi:hypothetical protein
MNPGRGRNIETGTFTLDPPPRDDELEPSQRRGADYPGLHVCRIGSRERSGVYGLSF